MKPNMIKIKRYIFFKIADVIILYLYILVTSA